MGNTATCETNCAEIVLVGEPSEWATDGRYDYQYGTCECKNCGNKRLCLRSRSHVWSYISTWQPYNKYKCEHSAFKVNEKTIECHSVGGIENASNGFSIMFLAPFFPAKRYATADAKCIRCGEEIKVRSEKYKNVIRNKEQITIIEKCDWNRVIPLAQRNKTSSV